MYFRLAFAILYALIAASFAAAEPAKLQIETVKTGDCSRTAKPGDVLKMHYEGTLQSDGSEFDSSYKRGEPFTFTLGAGMVIQGWDEGLKGVCVGEIRNLIIPPHMGYGDDGYPPVIPKKATLKFKVELVGFGDVEEDDDDDDEEDEQDEL